MTPTRITDLITRAGITRYKLAKILNIDTACVYRWTEGKYKPERYFQEKLKELEKKVEKGVDLTAENI